MGKHLGIYAAEAQGLRKPLPAGHGALVAGTPNWQLLDGRLPEAETALSGRAARHAAVRGGRRPVRLSTQMRWSSSGRSMGCRSGNAKSIAGATRCCSAGIFLSAANISLINRFDELDTALDVDSSGKSATVYLAGA